LRYDCIGKNTTLRFSESSPSGQPILNYESEDIQMQLVGDQINLGFHREHGIPVYVPLNHPRYGSMSVFFPFPKDCDRLPSHPGTISLVSKVKTEVQFSDPTGMLLPGKKLKCTVMKVAY
jgi:hypothetical protein